MSVFLLSVSSCYLIFQKEKTIKVQFPGAKDTIIGEQWAIVLSIVLASFYSASCQSPFLSILNDK